MSDGFISHIDKDGIKTVPISVVKAETQRYRLEIEIEVRKHIAVDLMLLGFNYDYHSPNCPMTDLRNTTDKPSIDYISDCICLWSQIVEKVTSNRVNWVEND